MKTWEICVEDGPHQCFYVEAQARTLDEAIHKVRSDMKKQKPWLHILISHAACREIK